LLLRSGWPGWCRKNPSIFEAPSPVILKSATVSYPTLLSSSPYRQHTKNIRFTKTLFLNIVGRRNKCAGMPAYGQVGSTTGGQWAAMSPWILHLPPLGRMANKKIYWPILCYLLLVQDYLEITCGASSVTSPSSSTVSLTSFSSLEVQILFTNLSLNTVVLWHFYHKCTIS